MRRPPFTALAAVLSLLALVLFVWLWARSAGGPARRPQGVVYLLSTRLDAINTHHCAVVAGGMLHFEWGGWYEGETDGLQPGLAWAGSLPASGPTVFGVYGSSSRAIRLPAWLVAGGLAVLPARWSFLRWQRTRSRRPIRIARRRRLKPLPAISLVLCLAACATWVGSRGNPEYHDLIEIQTEAGVTASLAWSKGGLTFGRTYFLWPDNSGFAYRQTLGFAYFKFPGDNYGQTSITIPYWFCVLTLAIAPAVAAWRSRRAGSRDSLCHQCGYDLRATPNRCPECGAEPSAA